MAKNGTNKNKNNPVPPATGRKSLEEIKRELQSARPVYEDSQGRLTPVEAPEPAPEPPAEPRKFPGFQARATSPSRPVRSKANEALIPTQRSPLAGRPPAGQSDQLSFGAPANNQGQPSASAIQPSMTVMQPPDQLNRVADGRPGPTGTQAELDVYPTDGPITPPRPTEQPKMPTQLSASQQPFGPPPGDRSAPFQPGMPPPPGWQAGLYSPRGPVSQPYLPQDQELQYQGNGGGYQSTSPHNSFGPTNRLAPNLNEQFRPSEPFQQPPASSNGLPPLNGTPTMPLSTDEVRRRLSEQTVAFRPLNDSAPIIEGELGTLRPVGQSTEPFKVIQNHSFDQPTQSFNVYPAADSGSAPVPPPAVITPARPVRPTRLTSFRWPTRPVLLVGVAGLVGLIILVLLIVLLTAKKDPVVADNLPTVTPAPVTTAVITTSPAQTTAAPATTETATTAAVTSVPATTASANAQALADAKAATDKEDWPTVVKLLEPIDQSSQDFYQARPLLLKAYQELGRKASRDPSNSEESANEAVSNYQKAQKLAPNNDQLKLLLNRAVRYQQGRYYVTHNQPDQAVTPLRDLYAEMSALNPPQRYRNSPELLFNTLLNLGDLAAQKGDKASLEAARNLYTEASKVDVANKGLAASRVKQMDDALNPATPTPAPQSGGSGGWVRPAPTPTRAPAPTKPAQTAPKPTAVVNMPQMPSGSKPSPQACGQPGQPNC